MASKEVEKMDETGEVPVAGPSNEENTKMDTETASSFEINSRPICLIVLGMAGSGKTSFVKRLTQLGHLQNMKPYVVNLDPACAETPYHTNIGKITILCDFTSLKF